MTGTAINPDGKAQPWKQHWPPTGSTREIVFEAGSLMTVDGSSSSASSFGYTDKGFSTTPSEFPFPAQDGENVKEGLDKDAAKDGEKEQDQNK